MVESLWKQRRLEFYNECHDPDSGEFCESDGPAKRGPKPGNYDEHGRQVSQTGKLHGRYKIREVHVSGNTVHVPLSDDPNGPKAIADLSDLEVVNKYRWTLNNDGHPYTKVRGKNVSMHQLLTGEKNWDHVNRDKLDNRRANLRPSSKTLNEANTGPRATNTSGYKGVVFDRGKWVGRIGYKDANGKNIAKNLGRFNTPEEAAEAYNKAAKDLHGDHAYQNKIERGQ